MERMEIWEEIEKLHFKSFMWLYIFIDTGKYIFTYDFKYTIQ